MGSGDLRSRREIERIVNHRDKQEGMDGGIEMKGEEREAGALALLDSFLLLPLLFNLRPIKFTITFATSVMWHLGSPCTLPWDTRIISAKPS